MILILVELLTLYHTRYTNSNFFSSPSTTNSPCGVLWTMFSFSPYVVSRSATLHGYDEMNGLPLPTDNFCKAVFSLRFYERVSLLSFLESRTEIYLKNSQTDHCISQKFRNLQLFLFDISSTASAVKILLSIICRTKCGILMKRGRRGRRNASFHYVPAKVVCSLLIRRLHP